MLRVIKPTIYIACFLFFWTSISPVYGQSNSTTSPKDETTEIEQGGALLDPGQFIWEPGIQYSHTSRTRLSISGFTIFEAIVLGRIQTEDSKKDVIMPYMNFKAGLLKNLQLDIKVPFLYRRDRITSDSNDDDEKIITDANLGDIEAALYTQVLRERGAIPDLIINTRVKSRTGQDPYDLETDDDDDPTELPTGSGHWGVSWGLTASKSSDPALLFASLNYYYNIKRDIGDDIGEIEPGDSIEYGFGLAYALNERLSSSIFYQQRIYDKTKQNGEGIDGSDLNVSTLYFGANYALSPQRSISVSLGTGLSEDAPDVTLQVSMPILFGLDG
ncbi:transporter [Desulfohalobium retbaense]|uniref:Transporter n=1 Tax=Desulfohalobium retbaense (strain ATCC 49708 / DSM 5692 / JCM 16813 / HR100) TaxID=485915 RepID=C8X5N5_DESRD|nr:transporter [Desulfohalobium retbaense]ACV69732.1 conserved hypothetical protein [Desulfohalobium retbaense DSM 5692]